MFLALETQAKQLIYKKAHKVLQKYTRFLSHACKTIKQPHRIFVYGAKGHSNYNNKLHFSQKLYILFIRIRAI